ncbi:phosphate ABC transporter substrate-binding protein [Deltaproteobacteria bacterium Smac51]|nr:phosphate ABC transporter substrate-binding protein [Deltaproteobacteria bacterium Smac51]
MSLKRILFALIAAALTLNSVAALAQTDKNIRISGSTTVLPIAQKAAEVYMGLHPDMMLSVSGTGSGDGLKAIVEGSVDIANSSRDLKDKEKARAEQEKVKLVRHAVALDCVAVVVNPNNPVKNLTLGQLKNIYNGTYISWKEVGGEDKPIVPINRDASSGTFEVWLEKVMKGERVRPDAQVQASNGGVAQAVAGNKYAIGYVGLGYINPQIKALEIESIKPSVATVQDSTYPISRELYMFTREDGTDAANSFITFLISPDGQKLVEQEGFVPKK